MIAAVAVALVMAPETHLPRRKENQHPHIVLVADDQTLGFVNQGRFGQPCTDDEHGYERNHVRVDEAAKGLGRVLMPVRISARMMPVK